MAFVSADVRFVTSFALSVCNGLGAVSVTGGGATSVGPSCGRLMLAFAPDINSDNAFCDGFWLMPGGCSRCSSSLLRRSSSRAAAPVKGAGRGDCAKVTRRAILDGERSPGLPADPGDVGVVSRPRFSDRNLVGSLPGPSDAPAAGCADVDDAAGGARGDSVAIGPCSGAMRRGQCESRADSRSNNRTKKPPI